MTDAVEAGASLVRQAVYWLAQGKDVFIILTVHPAALEVREIDIEDSGDVARLALDVPGKDIVWYVALQHIAAITVRD